MNINAMNLHDLLRRRIARIEGRGEYSLPADPGLRTPALAAFGLSALDEVLGGGLAAGTLHEVAGPAGAGLCLRLAPAARPLFWLGTEAGFATAGLPHAPGLEGLGLDLRRLFCLVLPRAEDVLWAAEEALRCRAVGAVLVELPGPGKAADLTATRRLSLAARDGGGFAFLVRHQATAEPSAAATRWTVAPVPGPVDGFGGLGETALDLTLTKNRRGPCGRWTITWRRDDRRFTLATPADPAAVPLRRAG
ncbi:ImuA family protein [Zavarzinia sp.]|uniref:ImuA family protein n=1 Tax=Zavarzinia sp. TaxID=2027920 RepID=UPI00356B1D4E